MGRFPILRHNEIRELTTSMLSEVCTNVSVEPFLQELSGKTLSVRSANRDSDAQADVAVDGFWDHRRERMFADICVFTTL